MCLSHVRKYKPCKKGYKLMSIYQGTLGGAIFSVSKKRPVGKWLNEKSYRDYACDTIEASHDAHSRYPCGWHIYHFRSDALRMLDLKIGRRSRWVIVEVEVRSPVATGVQYHYIKPLRITVAEDIKITSVLDV